MKAGKGSRIGLPPGAVPSVIACKKKDIYPTRKGREYEKEFLAGGARYLLPTFPLGYLWHLVTFKDAYDRLDLYLAEVIIPFGLASMLVQAIIFASIYPKLFSTRREQKQGSTTFRRQASRKSSAHHDPAPGRTMRSLKNRGSAAEHE